MIIVLLGESASGKSTIEKIISNKYNYEKTISYTTRPIRSGEKNGVDYHYISNDDFLAMAHTDKFAEVGLYNGWLYGTTKEQYLEDNIVCVLTPHGMRQIKRNLDSKNMRCFYIKTDRSKRLIKALERGDNVDEAIRRNQSDVGQYDGIEDEVDFVIQNNYLSAEQLADTIVSICETEEEFLK